MNGLAGAAMNGLAGAAMNGLAGAAMNGLAGAAMNGLAGAAMNGLAGAPGAAPCCPFAHMLTVISWPATVATLVASIEVASVLAKAALTEST